LAAFFFLPFEHRAQHNANISTAEIDTATPIANNIRKFIRNTTPNTFTSNSRAWKRSERYGGLASADFGQTSG